MDILLGYSEISNWIYRNTGGESFKIDQNPLQVDFSYVIQLNNLCLTKMHEERQLKIVLRGVKKTQLLYFGPPNKRGFTVFNVFGSSRYTTLCKNNRIKSLDSSRVNLFFLFQTKSSIPNNFINVPTVGGTLYLHFV